MRVTFSVPPGPDLDLELTVGVPVASLRPGLAAVTGCAGVGDGPLTVGTVLLDDTHLTGTFPLVAGARITLGRPRPADDGVFAAARADRHLAVVSGPDAGLVQALGPRLLVGRDGGDSRAAGTTVPRLGLRDALVSHRHLEVRAAGKRVRVRDLGSANGARHTRRWLRHRWGTSVPRWWTRWRDGDRVQVGATLLETRCGTTAPGAAPPGTPTPDGRDAQSARAEADPARPTGPPPREPGNPPRRRTEKLLLITTALAPALGSLALLSGTGNPAALALGLAGPALLPLLLRARSSPTAAPADGAPAPARTGPALSAARLSIELARAVLTRSAAHPSDVLARLAPTGTLAVLGPTAREVAATLVLAAQPGRVEVRGPGAHHWDWVRWLTPEQGQAAHGPDVVVVDGGPAPGDAGGRTVVLVGPPSVPSWCGARLDAGRWAGPDGERPWSVEAGSARWAEQQARLVAAARCVQELGAAALPDAVTLGELGLPAHEDELTAAWGAHDDGLVAVLGAGPGGQDAVVDLVREGPHALVAGTTGSGKSELLRALVASLAMRYPPTALSFALVDFKGGAGFGALSELPHVVGTVTDLDAHEAARALAGLAAELRARKEVLARVGVTDLRDWPASASVPHPGRLVVVIDEFRALAEELPDLMGALVRIATQGRSLGVHLVLATQRPSGVVSAELRANVALRLALRVTDAADSADVLDVPDAARISPARPGRALLRRGPGPVEELQVALLGAGLPPVRLADDGVACGDPVGGSALEPDEALVAAVTMAADRWRPASPRPAAPWLPALPNDVTLANLEPTDRPAGVPVPAGEPGPAGALPFGLADAPDARSRTVAAWDPTSGHLIAVGGPASGRTTLLTTLAATALEHGWAVHAVGLPSELLPSAPGLGTVCDPADPRRLARLVTVLLAAPPRTVLLVDGIERVGQALDEVARGEGAVRFLELLQERAVPVAATASGTNGPWLAHAAHRVVLPLADDATESLAGVPRALCGARRGPGRAVWLPPRAEPLVCQVARPVTGSADRAASEPRPAGSGSPVPERPAATSRSPEPLPVRLQPIPFMAARPDMATSRRARLAVGVGGDEARVVGLDPEVGGLVVGPPGSGRSTALAHLLRSAHELGLAPLVIARDGPVRDAAVARGAPQAAAPPGAPAAVRAGVLGFDPEALLERLAAAERPDVVVVDDLDALARLAPDVTELLDDAVERGTVLLASLTTTAALSAYRGAVPALRARRHGIVLAAHTPGSEEIFGSPLAWHLDPARPGHAGRGVLHRGSEQLPVQVFAPLPWAAPPRLASPRSHRAVRRRPAGGARP